MLAKVLIYDIEVSPLLCWTWSTYNIDRVIRVEEEWYMMSYSWKWLGQKQTFVRALPDYPTYKENPKNDVSLVKELAALFEVADIIVAHNGVRFDDKKSNARFIYHDLPTPPRHKQIDTLKEAKKHFAFTSNKLDDLGEHLGLGRKVDTGGFDLWLDCMRGDAKAWNKMKKYNKQDVVLLEKVYLKLRPWMTTHPSLSLLNGDSKACPTCGLGPLQKRGRTPVGRVSWKQRFVCLNCRANVYGRPTERTDTQYI